MSKRPSANCKTLCPECGHYFTKGMYAKWHQGSGQCRAYVLTDKLKEEGWAAPGDYRASVNTVAMLARHAGIELRKEPVRHYDLGKNWQGGTVPDATNPKNYRDAQDRYELCPVYVAPVWLCKVAVAWRKWGNHSKFPKRVLERLADAKDNVEKQNALIALLSLKNKKS